jgi:hypothetical protein
LSGTDPGGYINNFLKGEIMKAKSIFVVPAYLVLSVTVYADITIFDSNSIISDGNTYDTVAVKGDSTVVTMTGGMVNKLVTMNRSKFNMSGGNIGHQTSSYDSSVQNLSGGHVQTIKSHNESKVNISGNVSISSDCVFYDSTIVTVSSGNVNINQLLELFDNSTLNLLAGSISDISLFPHGSGTLNIVGGEISGSLSAGGNNCKVNILSGTINLFEPCGAVSKISGGTINALYYNQDSVPQYAKDISIIGYDLSAVPYGGDRDEGEVIGYWNNHVPFRINLWGSTSPYKDIVLYDSIIPPECTNKPNSDLSGDCKVNFIDLAKMCSEWLDDGSE